MVETWQVLIGVTTVMVVYVATTSLFGATPSVPELALAVVFGLGGWFLGQRITDRFFE